MPFREFQKFCSKFFLLYFRRLSPKLVLSVIDQMPSQLGQVFHFLLTDVARELFWLLHIIVNEAAVIVLEVSAQQSFGGERVVTLVTLVLCRGRLGGVEVEGCDVSEERMVLREGPAVRTDGTEPLLLQVVDGLHVGLHVVEAVLVLTAQRAPHQAEAGQDVCEPVDVHLGLVLQLDLAVWTLGYQVPLVLRGLGQLVLLLLLEVVFSFDVSCEF